MLYGILLVGRGGGIPPIVLALIVIAIIALLLSQQKRVQKVIAPGRHSWTPDEQRATIKFYLENHGKNPQEYEETLLQLSRDLAIKPNAVRVAVDAVGRLEKANGQGKVWGASKQLRRVWAEYRGKKP